jgi:hypothetical protein
MYFIEPIDLIKEQQNDSWCKYMKKKLRENKLKKNEIYTIEKSILLRKVVDSKGIERSLVCLPSSLKKEAIYSLHNDVTAGHLGFIKTLYKLKERFYFPKIDQFVRHYVRSCKDCQSRKRDYGQPKGDLQVIDSQEPFSLVGMDILGPLAKSDRDYKYIIILVDHFTKYVEASPLKEAHADDVANFFIMSGVLRHGAIKRVLTDRGQNFCSRFANEVFDVFNVKHVRTTAYHPQTNGLAEKQCKTMTDMLALYVKNNQKDWDLFIPYLVFAYNTARQDSTKYSPFYLVYGRDPVLPIDICLNLPKVFFEIEDISSRFIEARILVKQSVLDSRRRQIESYNKRHRNITFEIGDKVLVYIKTRKVGLSEKLINQFYGPYEVIEKLTPVTYLLENMQNKKQIKTHIDRIKPYYDDDMDVADEEIWVKFEKREIPDEVDERDGQDVDLESTSRADGLLHLPRTEMAGLDLTPKI